MLSLLALFSLLALLAEGWSEGGCCSSVSRPRAAVRQEQEAPMVAVCVPVRALVWQQSCGGVEWS